MLIKASNGNKCQAAIFERPKWTLSTIRWSRLVECGIPRSFPMNWCSPYFAQKKKKEEEKHRVIQHIATSISIMIIIIIVLIIIIYLCFELNAEDLINIFVWVLAVQFEMEDFLLF